MYLYKEGRDILMPSGLIARYQDGKWVLKRPYLLWDLVRIVWGLKKPFVRIKVSDRIVTEDGKCWYCESTKGFRFLTSTK